MVECKGEGEGGREIERETTSERRDQRAGGLWPTRGKRAGVGRQGGNTHNAWPLAHPPRTYCVPEGGTKHGTK